MICVSLGGRISEELNFGKITTGASDDIKKITQIAQSLIGIYGMSKKIGLRSLQSEGFAKAISDETNYEFDMEVRQVVDECYSRTRELLQDKQSLIVA
jgi:ATP-dependent Zn protease